MAKNILAAQVNTSIMEGTESTFSVDVKDYLGESVDISLITLRCSLSNGDDCTISWNAELGVHELTIPALKEGRYEYEIDELLDTGETVALVTGVIGVFNRDSWQEPALSTTSPNRTLRIVKADEKGQIEATWLATSAAAGYAYEARKNADVLRDAMPLILQAAEFMKSFDEALREHIKVVNDYLWIGGVNTGHYLRGADGETPRYGSDGWWYIGSKRVGKARGDDGITPHITSDGYWAFGSQKTNVRAAGKDGINGASMRRVLIQSLDELPNTEERGVYYYLKDGEHYDVYVWLEPDGWVCVGEANDIATSEVYGLVKLGTDVQVDNGAPVGRDVDGHMSVPLAGTAVAGANKLSTSVEMSTARKDGVIGKTANGELMARRARPGQPGVIEPSRTDGKARVLGLGVIPDGTMVDGLDRSGLFGCTRAEPDTYGMVKAAFVSTSSSCDEILWNIPIAMREDMQEPVEGTTDVWYRGANGMLFVPLAQNGAIRWYSTSQRTKDGKRWSTGGSLTFVHTSQFEQTETGLALLSATSERLAGVYLAANMSDTRSAAVPSAGVVVNYLNEHYYEKSVVYTKQETLTQIEYKLQTYATISWVSDNYMTRSQIMAELEKKLGCPSGRAKNIEFLTASERESLSSIDQKTAYLVYAG